MKNIKDIIIGSLIVIIIALILIIIIGYDKKIDDEPLLNDVAIDEPINETNKVYVDIKGQVKSPGVYLVEANSIINDVIKLAGGLTKNAYTKNINLSKKVTNEMVIYIFSKKEMSKPKETTTTFIENIQTTTGVTTSIISYDNCLTSTTTTSQTTNIENNSQLNENELVNINTSSKEMLMNIPGIGEAKADAIIIYRQNNTFNTIEDIKNVSGIGESLFVKIKDHITV